MSLNTRSLKQLAGNSAPDVLKLFEEAPGFFAYLSGPEHVFEFVNKGCTALLGNRALLGKSFKEALPDLDGQGYYETLDRVYASGRPFIGSGDMLMLENPDGTFNSCTIDFLYQPVRDEHGMVCGIICQGHDVTQRVAAEQARDVTQRHLESALETIKESEARFLEMANNIEDIFYSWDAESKRMLYINPACETVWGVSQSELKENALRYFEVVLPEDREELRLAVERLLQGEHLDKTYRIKSTNGSTRWVREKAYPVLDDAGVVRRIVGTARDVTERERVRMDLKRKQKKFAHLASHDVLTGLPNRAFLRFYMRRLLSQEKEQTFAILYVDVDHFKKINDTRGHGVGDEVLKIISERLCRCVSSNDIVVRMGGDEFVVVATHLASAKNSELIAERIIQALSAPVRIENDIFHISASLGIATYPDNGQDLQTLLQHADIALYHTKENGRDGYHVFGAGMTTELMQRTSIEQAMRLAIGTRQFYLQYQPIVDLNSGRVTALEALLRWCHPELGLVSPNEFIPLAESTGLIRDIGAHVLKDVAM